MSQPYLLLTLAPLLWGGNITAGRLAVDQISPDLLVLGRWVGAFSILLIFAIPHVRRDWSELKKGWRLLLFYGIVGFAGFNMAMYTAALFTTGVNASLEQAAIPVFVLIGNLIFFAVRPTILQVIGLGITMLGVVWVATQGQPARIAELDINIGDALVILACLFYAIYSLLLKFRPKISWISFIFVTAFGALIASVFFVAAGPGGLPSIVPKIQNVTPLGWLILAYVACLPSIVAQLAYARGLSIVGPNRAAIFINLLPLFGTVLSVLFIGEALQPFHFIAAAMVFSGIILSEYSAYKSK